MSTTRARKPTQPRITYVVIVKTGEVSIAVYGPYRSFKRAEGDAKAWDGTVEPMNKPSAH